MPANYYTGGMSSISYKLAKNKPINGFGASKRNINNPLFRGGAGPEEIIEDAQPKRSRGRPKKNIISSTAKVTCPTTAEEEEYYYEYKPKYKDNAVEMLNGALNSLRLESLHIKRSVMDPLVQREENKRIKKLERDINKALFNTF